MFINYLFIALRSLLKHKVYAAINTVGLVAGIFFLLVIFLYADYELGYYEFHKNHNDIYRVAVSYKTNSGIDINSALSPSAMGPQLQRHANGVRNAVRFLRYQGTAIIKDGKKKDVYNENAIFKTDPGLLSVFSYSMLH